MKIFLFCLSIFLMLPLQGMKFFKKPVLFKFMMQQKKFNYKHQVFKQPCAVLSDSKIAFQAIEDNDIKLFKTVVPLLSDMHVRDGLFEEPLLYRAISLEREEFVTTLLADKRFKNHVRCLGMRPKQWAELWQKEKMVKFLSGI